MSADIRPFVKGVFVLLDGAPIPFLYNPDEIPETREVQYAKLQPRGYSHPVYHYEYGLGRDLNFTMTIRDKFEVGGTTIKFPLEAYIALLYDLTYPIIQAGTMVDGPPTLYFVFQALVRRCKIKRIEVVRKQWDRFLSLRYAEVKISLFEVVTENQNRINSVKSISKNGAITNVINTIMKGL